MKTFRVIGIALLTVLMCVNFTACSEKGGDDDPTGDSSTNQPTNEKKLVKIIEQDNDGNERIIEFKYNEDGNVIEANEWSKYSYDDAWRTDRIIYNWNSRELVTIIGSGFEEGHKLTLSNDRVRNEYQAEYKHYTGSEPFIDESFIFYNYDKNRNLTEYGAKWSEEGEYEAIYKLNWNEKQVASIEDYYSDISTILYENRTCKGFFPLFACCFDDGSILKYNYIFIAQPQLIGLKTNYLPTKIIGNADCSFESFEYEFNTDGYIETCIADKNYYEFVWE